MKTLKGLGFRELPRTWPDVNVPRQSGVYALVEDDVILYIGEAQNLRIRLWQHWLYGLLGENRRAARRGPQFCAVCGGETKHHAIVAWIKTDITAVVCKLIIDARGGFEERLIQMFQPPHNVRGNTRDWLPRIRQWANDHPNEWSAAALARFNEARPTDDQQLREIISMATTIDEAGSRVYEFFTAEPEPA